MCLGGFKGVQSESDAKISDHLPWVSREFSLRKKIFTILSYMVCLPKKSFWCNLTSRETRVKWCDISFYWCQIWIFPLRPLKKFNWKFGFLSEEDPPPPKNTFTINQKSGCLPDRSWTAPPRARSTPGRGCRHPPYIKWNYFFWKKGHKIKIKNKEARSVLKT